MRGTIPTLHCDHEDGCDAWTPNYYELTVQNWRDCMPGWQHDPHRDRDAALCPEHAPSGAHRDESDASGRAARARACPTCNGQIPVSGLRLRARETVGLVCPTCGWDYGEDGEPIDSGASRGAV